MIVVIQKTLQYVFSVFIRLLFIYSFIRHSSYYHRIYYKPYYNNIGILVISACLFVLIYHNY